MAVLDELRRRPLALFLPLQAALLLAALGSLPIWGDEQFTLDVVALPWAAVPAALAADIHPPLYFLLLKLWMAIGGGLEPIVWARAFSVVTALAATVLIDRLWLRERPGSVRVAFLTLWTLSPAMLLYARMARSYALQLLLGVVVIALARRAAEEPRPRRLAALAIGIAALLYTHYLPGLALGAAAVGLLAVRAPRAGLATAAATALLYAPWLPVLLDGLSRAAVKPVYRIASPPLEIVLRAGYGFLSLTFGEAHTTASFTAAALLTPGVLWLLWRGVRVRPQPVAGWAAPVGALGTWRWVALAFTPARMLFLLPSYLLTLAEGAHDRLGRAVLAGVVGVGVASNVLLLNAYSLLNPGYVIPFSEIAERINRGSAEAADDDRRTLVVVDSFGADPRPLIAALDRDVVLVVARHAEFVGEVEGRLRQAGPQRIWYLRTVRDASPRGLHSSLEARLAARCVLLREDRLVPYTPLLQTAYAALGGGGDHHYRVAQFDCPGAF